MIGWLDHLDDDEPVELTPRELAEQGRAVRWLVNRCPWCGTKARAPHTNPDYSEQFREIRAKCASCGKTWRGLEEKHEADSR